VPATIPVFPVRDIQRTADFYGPLGFAEDDRAPDYLIVVHPVGIELHFHLEGRWGVGGSAHSGAAYVRFDTAAEARDLYQAWGAVAEVSELHETHYGLLEFGLVDPFGNTIDVGGPSSG
jgi:catechol 2,3-dioxygenase-like lactoylglutathione lyase family enzyme